jgi:hypothetical protein
MEPGPTLAEAARLLAPGGAFAAYHHALNPVLLDWRADQALQAFDRDAKAIRPRPGQEPVPQNVRQRWSPDGHGQRLTESGHFRHVRELRFDHQSWGTTEDLIAYCRAVDGVHRLLAAGRAEIVSLLERLEGEVRRWVGEEGVPWLWSYRVWVGIR